MGDSMGDIVGGDSMGDIVGGQSRFPRDYRSSFVTSSSLIWLNYPLGVLVTGLHIFSQVFLVTITAALNGSGSFARLGCCMEARRDRGDEQPPGRIPDDNHANENKSTVAAAQASRSGITRSIFISAERLVSIKEGQRRTNAILPPRSWLPGDTIPA